MKYAYMYAIGEIRRNASHRSAKTDWTRARNCNYLLLPRRADSVAVLDGRGEVQRAPPRRKAGAAQEHARAASVQPARAPHAAEARQHRAAAP